MKFTSAVLSNPISLKPLNSIPGSLHEIGYTGIPYFSPSLLLNFPFPLGFNIKGKCANFGGSQLNDL